MNKRDWLYGALGLLLALVFFVVQMPASMVLNYVAGQLPASQFHGVEGSLWSARIRTLQYDNVRLHNVSWQLSPWGLLLAQARLTVQIDDEQLQLQAKAVMSAGKRLQLTQTSIATNGPYLSSWLKVPGLQLQGNFDIDLQHADLKLTSVLPQVQALDAELHWQDAAVQTVLGHEVLGAYALRLQGDNAEIKGEISDQGGVLDLQGTVHLDAQRVSVDASVKRELRESLARFFMNFAQDDGSRYRLHWQRQLPVATP